MSGENQRQLRVLHIVSAGGAESVQQTLFMPLLTRIPKEQVQSEVVCLTPDVLQAAVLRQQGVPVHEIAMSRHRFAPVAFAALMRAAREFRPDIIQAWGLTAQLVSARVRARCSWKPRLVWTVASTTPIARNAGFFDKWRLRSAGRRAGKVDRIAYASEAGAAQHRLAGFPEGGHIVTPPGLDATRFKPDPALRQRVRDQLKLPPDAFVVGMVAPYWPASDHATFIKAMGELIRTYPQLTLVLAGRGVQKGNAQLVTLLGGGVLGTRTHLLGEWSDLASLFNACDMVCSSSLDDSASMLIAAAMLCGAPCVATGLGAQGEVIGSYGVAIEPGNPAAFVKGVSRIMQLTPERRAHLVQSARRHALKEFFYMRSLQKYLQLYFDLLGLPTRAVDVMPVPDIEVPAQPATPAAATPPAVVDVSANKEESAKDEPAQPPARPDMLEPDFATPPAGASAEPHSSAAQPEPARSDEALALSAQESASENAPVARSSERESAVLSDADVLELFELSIASSPEAGPSEEQPPTARHDEFEDLLAPEALTAEERLVQRASPPQPKVAASEPARQDDKLSATARMRAAAREELKRASASMAGGSKQPGATHESQGELQLALEPEDSSPRKKAAG